ncbi:MAG: hypothetical protein H6710_16695 [Myxococcales bacterium]|nr:hypothetical protein [Myxococcales bacterium]
MRRARRLPIVPVIALAASIACAGDDGGATSATTGLSGAGLSGATTATTTGTTSTGSTGAGSSASSGAATGQDASGGEATGQDASGGGDTSGDTTGDGDTTGPSGDTSGGDDTTTGGIDEPPAQKEVIFTRPMQGGASDLAIEAKLNALIGDALPGSSIRVALYHWSRVGVANELVAAKAKGVDVKVILDGSNDNKAVDALKAGLGAGNVVLCGGEGGGCIGDGINHNKLFLFSALADGSKDVVVQSSANLVLSQTRKHNNMVVIRDDAALYAAYAEYWDDLHAQKTDLNYYTSANGDTDTKVYFYPRASGDTIVSVLGNVECTPGTIRVAMAFFTDARVAIAAKLVELKEAGCDVAVILRDEDGYPGDDVLATLKAGKVGVTLYPEGPNAEGLHSKYLLIHSRYAGVDDRRVLWTGSHNYTGTALHSNDETLLRIEDGAIFDAFVADWIEMKSLAGTF